MGMVTGSGNSAITQTFSYDASGNVVSVNYNGTEYYYLRNAQNDIVKIIDGSGNTVVQYTYDSWGKILSTTGSLASTLGANQPFRYRGYVYDTETGWYYLQSRYYDPSIARFISADVYLSTGQGVLGHNAFAYCANNPIIKKDSTGYAVETVFDIITLSISIVEVASNPTDVWVWIGLVGDAVDLIPFVTGVGELVRTIRVVDAVDDVVDAARVVDNAGDVADAIGDTTRRVDYYVTPNGEIIPATIEGFNDNLLKLDNQGGKFIGTDSNGPIRIRSNEIHPDNPNFTGIKSEYHTINHFHIDRRINGKTGAWRSVYVGAMEMLY